MAELKTKDISSKSEQSQDRDTIEHKVRELKLDGLVEAISIIKTENMGKPIALESLEQDLNRFLGILSRENYELAKYGSEMVEYAIKLSRKNGNLACIEKSEIQDLNYLTTLIGSSKDIRNILLNIEGSGLGTATTYCIPVKSRQKFEAEYGLSPEKLIENIVEKTRPNLINFINSYKRFIEDHK